MSRKNRNQNEDAAIQAEADAESPATRTVADDVADGNVIDSVTGDPAAGVITQTEQASNEAQNAGANRKSIVPQKYGNKYKNGGSDNLAKFINEQSADNNTFSFAKFFALARANGLDAAKVDSYEAAVNEKKHGAPGRARMTLRNMLATVAKKDGGLVGNDGEKHTIEMPKKETASAE